MDCWYSLALRVNSHGHTNRTEYRSDLSLDVFDISADVFFIDYGWYRSPSTRSASILILEKIPPITTVLPLDRDDETPEPLKSSSLVRIGEQHSSLVESQRITIVAGVAEIERNLLILVIFDRFVRENKDAARYSGNNG